MARGEFLGDFEHLILLAVLRLRDEGYGLTIRDEINERTGRTISTGAVYTTLDRLERKGLLTSHVAQGGADRDNRRRRLYALTGGGIAAVSETQAAIRSMSRGLRLGESR
jgi:PadR family transcriptional regulator PadR